jgi:hypothetical protein
MAWTPPRRAVSTATTITVSETLPAWYTEANVPKGRWTNITALIGASTPRARADSTLAGTYGGGYFSPNRWGAGNNPFWDFTTGIWIPTLGNYGMYVMRGGGHATNIGMLDMGTYGWNPETRLWEVVQAPIYPGELATTGPAPWGYDGAAGTYPDMLPSPDYDPLKLYGEVSSTPGSIMPCATHTQWDMVYITPGKWGTGSKGGLCLVAQSSHHNLGSNDQAHILDLQTMLWSRVGQAASGRGGTGGGGAMDSSGTLWRRAISRTTTYDELQTLPHNGATWTRAPVSNFTGNLMSRGSMAYIPDKDLMAFLVGPSTSTGQWWITLMQMSETGSNPIPLYIPGGIPGVAGAQLPTIGGASNFHDTGFVWCDDMNSLVLWSPRDLGVYAFTPPSTGYLTTRWTCTKLASANSISTPYTLGSTPTNAWHNRFQYAPPFKAFFVVGDAVANDMWCFRPSASELP